MSQRDTLVARAIVAQEIQGEGRLVGGASPLALTVPEIAAKYRLDWGTYEGGASRAEQLVRKALNEAVQDGRLRRLPTRDGYWVVYTRAN